MDPRERADRFPVVSVPYRSLLGGYLIPRWTARKYEGWRAAYSVTEDLMPGHTSHVGGSGTVTVVQSPLFYGDFALHVESWLGAGPTYDNGIAVSELATDLDAYQGIGIAHNVIDAAHLTGVRLRFYTLWDLPTPSYYEYVFMPEGPTSTATFLYGTGTYGTARYSAVEEGLDAWELTIIPKELFTAVGTPSWATITRAEVAVLVSGGAADVYFDQLSGWVELEPEDAAANRMMSNLPEYHWDQPFNDAVLQTMGYELDAIRGMLEYGLDQRVPALAEWGLRLHEAELGLTVEPLLWPEVKRRALVEFLSGQPVTKAEMEEGLSSIVQAPVTITETFASYSVEFAVTLTSTLDQAMLKLAVERVLPAHLAYTTDFT